MNCWSRSTPNRSKNAIAAGRTPLHVAALLRDEAERVGLPFLLAAERGAPLDAVVYLVAKWPE